MPNFTTVRIYKKDREKIKKESRGENFAEKLRNYISGNKNIYLTKEEIGKLIERKIQGARKYG